MPRSGRGRWVSLWLVGSLVVAVVAFGVGTLVTSPWQEAVENSQENLAVPVKLSEQVFQSDIPTVQGTLTLGQELSVAAPEGISHVVITQAAPQVGEQIDHGDVLMGISGRPLFALNLDIPFYRDIEPGMSGPDVESLQNALGSLGLYRGYVDGEYGRGTVKAVKALYKQAGYPVPESLTETRDVPNPKETDQKDQPPAISGSDSGSTPPADGTVVVDLGTILPMSEFMDLPKGEVTLVKALGLGSKAEPSAAVATLRTGGAKAVARVGAASSDSFGLDQPAAISFPGSQVGSVDAPITEVSDFLPGTEEGVPPGYDVTVSLELAQVEGLADSFTISMTPAGKPESTTALGIPLTALREDSEGIYVLVPGEIPTRVSVQLGARSGGYAEVLEGSELVVGTEILLGTVVE